MQFQNAARCDRFFLFREPFKMHFSSTRFSNTHRDSQEHVSSTRSFHFAGCCCWCWCCPYKSEEKEKKNSHIRHSRSQLKMGSFNNNIPILYVEILYKYWYLARCIFPSFSSPRRLFFSFFFPSASVFFINKSCLKMNKSWKCWSRSRFSSRKNSYALMQLK